MKKIFTLVAMTLVALGVNAQTWRPTEEAPAAYSNIIKDDLLKVNTVFETTAGKIQNESGEADPQTFSGLTFEAYMQVRVADAPSADNLTGTDNGNGTPLEIKPQKNVDITIYYRRQAKDGGYADNDGKDVKLIDQSAPTTVIAAATFESFDIDGSYANAKKIYKLEAGKTYTLWAKGTTIRLYGIDYAEGTGSGGEGGGSSAEEGTYFISYNDTPTLTSLTTEEMTNTGTSTNVATWSNGFSLMIMRSDKAWSNGNNITIDGSQYKTLKVSNGAQNKLTLPEGTVAAGITLYSYVNKDAATERDSYWKEIAGTVWDTVNDAPGGIFASYKDTENPDKREYSFGDNRLNVITFTNTGEQACFVIKITIAKGEVISGIQTIKANTINVNAPIYNLAGQKVSESYKGVVIQNGKKFVK